MSSQKEGLHVRNALYAAFEEVGDINAMNVMR